MTLITLKYLVQHIAQVFGKPLDMSLEQFNNLLAAGSDELFRQFASGYLQGNGAEVDSRVAAALAPFKTDRSFAAYTTTTMFGLTGHRVDVASDDYVYLSAFVAHDATAYPDKVINMDILTPSELGERLSNSITYPTETNPVMVLSSNSTGTSKYAFILPQHSVLPVVHVLSLRKPTTPNLVLSYTNGVETQAGTSTALEWDAIFHLDIVRIMLKYLGLSVGMDAIQQIIEQDKMAEK